MSLPPICNICKKEEDYNVQISNIKYFNDFFDNYVCSDCNEKLCEVIRNLYGS